MMKRIRLTDIGHPLFAKAWALYERAFPADERRTLAAQREVMAQPQYRFEAAVDDGELAGFLLWWRFEDLRYIEHFAVMPSLRGKGLGFRVLKDFIGESSGVPVLLEVEPPIDELARRRIGFYKRAGFVQNNHPYMQPPYRAGGNAVPLVLMSYPQAITEAGVEKFCERRHPVIYRP